MLKINDIHKSYGQPGEQNYRKVIDGLSFELKAGESSAILGPSGSGKTTLLNIIGTLDFPDSGQVLFEDIDLGTLGKRDYDQFRNRKIGFVFQLHHLLPQLSLLENVLVPALALNDKSMRKEKVSYAEELLKRAGIWEHRNKLPGKMSGGECQRAAVVRAVINRPGLLLADEPTGALDSRNAENITELLTELNKNDGLALIMVTHSNKLASQMGKVYSLESGKLKEISKS